MALRVSVGLVAARADLDAHAAAGAVLDRHLHGPLLAGVLLALGVDRLEGRRSALQVHRVVDLGADAGVRAVQRALAALDAQLGIPHRHLERDVALLPPRGVRRPHAVVGDLADGQLVALAGHDPGGHVLHEVGRGRRHQLGLVVVAGHRRGHLDAVEIGDRLVDRVVVHLHDLLAPLAVGLVDGLLDGGDGLFRRDDVREVEEAGLHDGVDAPAHAGLLGHLVGVDGVDLEAQLDDPLLGLVGQPVPDLLGREGRVDQEGAPRDGRRQRLVALDERPHVAGDEVGLVDQVGRADGLRARSAGG